MKYDAVLMLTRDKIPLLKTSYKYLIKNLGANKIILVASNSCREEIDLVFHNVDQIEYIDEDTLFDGLSFENVRSILESICGDGHRTGWFFQQFLKMSYAYRCQDQYYLLFDSDTVPLNTIHYFNDSEKPSFITKCEYYEFYFNTIDTLFNGSVKRVEEKVSYIAENMIINKTIMLEIIDKIMNNDRLTGSTFYERILRAIDIKDVKYTGFSEFETYGNYVMTFYPKMYEKKKLRTQRLGAFLFGIQPSDEQLEWASKDYDIISFESYGRRWLAKKTSSEAVRKRYSAKELFNRYIRMSNLCDILMLKPITKIDD